MPSASFPRALAFALSLPALLGLCACESLFSSVPDGVPPPGEIVKEIRDKQELPSPEKALNRASTSLMMKLVSLPSARKPPFVSLREGGQDDGGLGEELLKSLEKSKVARIQPKGALKGPDFIISSVLDRSSGKWTASLLSPDGSGRPLWAEILEMDASSLKEAQ